MYTNQYHEPAAEQGGGAMNPIYGEAAVSCYVDAASFLIMVLILFLSNRLPSRRRVSMRIFRMLSMFVAAICICPFIYNAMYMQPAPWCHTAAIIAKTLRECIVLLIVILWLVYVNHKLYGMKERHSLKLGLVFLPFAVFLGILIVNPFTGIAFAYSAENRFEPKPLMYVIFAVEFIYFAFSAVLVRYYDKKTKKARFLHVSPMIISIALASGTQFFAPYDIGVLGYVMGITMMYFSILGEIRFLDDETGLYNKEYMAYLFDMALAGKNDFQSALVLETDGNLPAGHDILRSTLHQNNDVIRVDEKKFLLFSATNSRTQMQYLSSLLDEAVEKHNAEHADEKVQISARCRMRTGNEDAFSFLRTVMEEKEGGDEMRGIVSMMSELDRLDKELELASDIQSNMLPMNFPPFPDRHEFDLYASMTPAKEVGGDFYDFFLIDSDHLGLVIADVSGKGIPAALFMMVSKTLIKNQLMAGCDPATALERVNLQLCERNSSMMFVTVWLAVLEISTGKGMACNAGHENPGFRRAGEGFELLKYKHGMFIGVSKKAKYQVREFELHPGDCVFVYTDGVPEATNAHEEMFGEGRLTDILNRNADMAPEELIRHVHSAVDSFADSAPQFDDITMLCLKYYGAQSSRTEQ